MSENLFQIPAFPQDKLHSADGSSGMTLFDYLVAHAPAMPPNWWKPVMPVKPSMHPDLYAFFHEEHERKWLGFYFEDEETWHEQEHNSNLDEDEIRVIIPDEFKEKVRKWQVDRELKHEAVRDWERQEQYEALVQWPYWWATQILINRERFSK